PLAQDGEELRRRREVGDLDVGSAHLRDAVRVASDAPGEAVLHRERYGPRVARPADLARVEHLDRVDELLLDEAIERAPVKVSESIAAERMRHVDEAALVADPVGGLLGRKPWRHVAPQIETDQLAVTRRDLLARDDAERRVERGETQAAGRGVVVGHAHRAETGLRGAPREGLEARAAVARELGMRVHVELDAVGHVRKRRQPRALLGHHAPRWMRSAAGRCPRLSDGEGRSWGFGYPSAMVPIGF